MRSPDRCQLRRFFSKVCVGLDGCWNWLGARNANGYGVFAPAGRSGRSAHRVAYEWFVGEVAASLHVDHLCRNRSCVNPAHLDAVTPTVNQRRARPMDCAAMKRAPTHPGEMFWREWCETQSPPVTQASAAKALGWSANRMSEFVLGKRPLTLEGVLDLAEHTGTSPEFWATLQLRHDLWHAMQARRQRG